MLFKDLGLSPKVLAAIEAAGFTEPTPIQAEAIPVANEGRDVLGIAQTGTGKTASFAIPMLMRMERGRPRARMPRSLVLAPTRELAAQVAESFELLGKNHRLTMALLIGGVSFDEQLRILDRGADVLIATPGRLLDHFGRGKLLLRGVEVLVIDEADRMLDMGFIPDIEKIVGLLPTKRQTLFFSATMPKEIQRLVDSFLNDPVRVEVDRQSTMAETITQRFKFCSNVDYEKRASLRELIDSQENINNAIIFCNRKRDVATLERSMKKHGYNVGALHGDMDQHQRMATLEAFRDGKITFLAASDVAARGLDIPEVSHIFNFDVPVQAEDYVHRIGRTGRAGREGYAATLVTSYDQRILNSIDKFSGDAMEWIGDAPADDDFDRKGGRGRGGRAGSTRKSEPSSSNRGSERSSHGGNQRPPRRKRDDRPDRTDREEAPGSEVRAKQKQEKREKPRAEPVKEAIEPREPDTEKSEKPKRRPRRAAAKPEAKNEPRQESGGSSRNKGVQPQGGQSRSGGQKGLGDHVPDFLKRPVKSG